jgi:hypothetical protein
MTTKAKSAKEKERPSDLGMTNKDQGWQPEGCHYMGREAAT